MLGGIEVFVFSMSGRSGKGKEEGVAPSSSGLLETDQEGGVSNSLFPSSSHLSSVGASGKPSRSGEGKGGESKEVFERDFGEIGLVVFPIIRP